MKGLGKVAAVAGALAVVGYAVARRTDVRNLDLMQLARRLPEWARVELRRPPIDVGDECVFMGIGPTQ